MDKQKLLGRRITADIPTGEYREGRLVTERREATIVEYTAVNATLNDGKINHVLPIKLLPEGIAGEISDEFKPENQAKAEPAPKDPRIGKMIDVMLPKLPHEYENGQIVREKTRVLIVDISQDGKVTAKRKEDGANEIFPKAWLEKNGPNEKIPPPPPEGEGNKTIDLAENREKPVSQMNKAQLLAVCEALSISAPEDATNKVLAGMIDDVTLELENKATAVDIDTKGLAPWEVLAELRKLAGD
ncbi:MAG: hypothetical protein RDU76_06290 [Candidatus Edwardsbacteria bacterium]|nr:hypothetical protein [Candidatus Edwardsbacteria bacterium]